MNWIYKNGAKNKNKTSGNRDGPVSVHSYVSPTGACPVTFYRGLSKSPNSHFVTKGTYFFNDYSLRAL